MFTDRFLENPELLLVIILGTLLIWRLIGSFFDARIFLSLNFSLISIWAFVSDSSLVFRLAVLLFMLLFFLGYQLPFKNNLHSGIDSALNVDFSGLSILLSAATVYSNARFFSLALYSGRSAVFELYADNPAEKYTGYVLLAGTWLTVHVICATASQRKWHWRQILCVVAAALAAASSLSKASFLPILLAYLFVYGSRLSLARVAALCGLGASLVLALVWRLFEDASISVVVSTLATRLIQNVDVLDYIEGLGPNAAMNYPFSSPFYLFWPVFQFTQQGFLPPGVWFYGMLEHDWRGFGPNSTFVVDFIIASKYCGLLAAVGFGIFLRTADKSRFRVLLALMCYTFLQDWYLGCVTFSAFLIFLTLTRLIYFLHHFISRYLVLELHLDASRRPSVASNATSTKVR